MLWYWPPWEWNGWLPRGRQHDTQGGPWDSVFHCDMLYHDSVYYPLLLSMKGGVSE